MAHSALLGDRGTWPMLGQGLIQRAGSKEPHPAHPRLEEAMAVCLLQCWGEVSHNERVPKSHTLPILGSGGGDGRLLVANVGAMSHTTSGSQTGKEPPATLRVVAYPLDL